MDEDQVLQDIAQYASECQEILDGFVKTRDALHIQSNDASRFKRIVMEISELLNDQLGENALSRNIVNTARTKIGWLGTPSFSGVRDVKALIESGIPILRRKFAMKKSKRSLGAEILRPLRPELAIQQIEKQIAKGKAILANRPIDNPTYSAWKAVVQDILIKAFGHSSHNNHSVFPNAVFMADGSGEYWENIYFESIDHAVKVLPGCIEQLQNEIEANGLTDDEPAVLALSAGPKPIVEHVRDGKTIFVVHGRNMKIRNAMFDFLRSVGTNPLEWNEAKSLTGVSSPYVGDVLDKAFNYAQAIVVLMTPDDVAMLKSEFHSAHDGKHETELTGQARQNVLFECGLAFGKNPNRTILVEFGSLRPFTDIVGRHTIRMDSSAHKRNDLVAILKTAGVAINIEGKNDWLSSGDFSL